MIGFNVCIGLMPSQIIMHVKGVTPVAAPELLAVSMAVDLDFVHEVGIRGGIDMFARLGWTWVLIFFSMQYIVS